MVGLISVGLVTPAAAAITGDEYAKLPPPMRLAFIAGALDAWEKMLGIERQEYMPSKFSGLVNQNFTCLDQWGNDDYRGALDAYLEKNESQKQYGAASALLGMIAERCSN